MKFVSCASYYGSGSSAITDFVSEFDGVFSFTDEEFRFVQDPDGISDLEYNLVQNFNRHNSGHALKRYKNLVDFYCGNILGKKYETFFHGNWKKYSYEYIDKLTEFTYNGWWQYDLMDKGTFFYFRKRILNKILHMTIWKNHPERTLNTMKKEITYCSHPTEEDFLNYTKEYIESLFSSVSNGADTVMVDQIVPPTNLARYLRYFNDIKVAVVDRDPRDIFVLEKYVWKDGIIPTDVETFCKWFKYTREHRKNESLESDSVCYVQFEDMVYHYEETKKVLMEWLGLCEERHHEKNKFFDPNLSIRNTQTWKKIECDQNEIRFIEKELSDYLYNFPQLK
ncbi:hypothetical protein J0J70_12350 [Turicibacter bilis]|uniref:Sulfotransferase domain-containing protein n=1 Tax=Turicibacter bilis TaxID=2735723 RepID=A0A9Q9CGY9_9FIRM|nr:hypothetical protein [Turicibacter bilis]MBS3196824.1 hypothetical protein [Turicibacter bilis]UUF08343.1 hypothetical protein J0J70_12350 [Turicibacter bilis]